MRIRRFITRQFVACFSVGVVTAAVVTWSDDRAFQRGATGLLHSELEEQALILEQMALPGLSDPMATLTLRARVTALGVSTTTRFTVIAADGTVIAESDEDPTQLDNHGLRPEVVAARTHGTGVARRHSTSLGRELLYLARTVRNDGGAILGFARVAREASAFDAILAEERHHIWLALAAGLAVAAALAWAMARHLTRPVGELRATAHAMAMGDDRRRALVIGDDEFAQLGRALNTMADRLQERVEEMRGERAKLTAILGGMVEGVAAVDVDERILHLNGAAADMLGATGGDRVGQPLLSVTRVPEICDLVATTLARDEKATREVSIHKGVETRTMQVEATPLRDGDGAVRGAILVLHDVTELRRLENLRRDFVANVSHELKTPLTAIKGLVDTIVDDRDMPATSRERFLGKVQRQADRLGNLVNDLLVLARIESSKSSDELLPVDLRDPVRESCAGLAVTAQQKDLRLGVVLPREPVIVRGESESLRQVVDNLLGNAIRYTPAQGAIDVTVTVDGRQAVLSVRDTGIGIEAAHLDRIFERFYRVDKARSRELGGTGLGLAIVKHVALAHGGTVAVSSRPGAGSSFSVCIPLDLSAQEGDES